MTATPVVDRDVPGDEVTHAVSAVLLFGMPRSGTTWIGKVFDSHPDVLYLHEPDSGPVLHDVPLLPDAGLQVHAERLRDFIDRLPSWRSARVAGKLPRFPKRYRTPVSELARTLMLFGAKAAGRLRVEISVPSLIAKGYRAQVRPVWKSIESLGRLGLLARTAPGVRAVHIIRHPCGYVDSVRRGEAVGSLQGSVTASEDRGIFEQLVRTAQARRYGLDVKSLLAMHPEERLAWRWALFNEKALDDTRELPNCRTVRYEDLCDDPEARFRELFDFAGLSWEPRTGAFLRASTTHDEDAYFGVHRDAARAARSWGERLPAAIQTRVLDTVRGTRAGAWYGL